MIRSQLDPMLGEVVPFCDAGSTADIYANACFIGGEGMGAG